MKKNTCFCFAACLFYSTLLAQVAPAKHPDTRSGGWVKLFDDSLTNAIFEKGVWTLREGVMEASKDEAIWSAKEYEDFILDLEFKTAPGTNSGVIVHASNIKDWIPNAVEIQIADDYSEQWSKAPATWQCAAIFGHQAASKKAVKRPGEWNHFTVTCQGKKISIVLNDELVNECDMAAFTSTKTNPDGSDIPTWLSKPMASLPLRGHVGFQGKHAGAPIYFRNIMIREMR